MAERVEEDGDFPLGRVVVTGDGQALRSAAPAGRARAGRCSKNRLLNTLTTNGWGR